jgi:hypothetical protein
VRSDVENETERTPLRDILTAEETYWAQGFKLSQMNFDLNSGFLLRSAVQGDSNCTVGDGGANKMSCSKAALCREIYQARQSV